MSVRVTILMSVLLGCGCAPIAGPVPPVAVKSVFLARLADDRPQAAIMDAVQQVLRTHPEWTARTASHGAAAATVYALTFSGSCAEETALVAAVTAIAQSNGAVETSCVPEARFPVGEAITFKRAE